VGGLKLGVLLILILGSFKMQAQQGFVRKMDTVAYSKTRMVLPQNFYNQHLSFFCKKESQLQKLANINLFIRLGSKEYVDYLEQKPNSKSRMPGGGGKGIF
jgi:hypothetical protein